MTRLCSSFGELEINTVAPVYSNVGLAILVKHTFKPRNISMQGDILSMKDRRDHVGIFDAPILIS